MAPFKAFRVHTIDGKAVCRFEELTIDQIDDGPVTIRTAYSAINYKDAMAARGIGKNVRTDRPCVTGTDLSGVVIDSKDARFKEGDPVVITNYQLGSNHDGAYADYARVPAEWIVPLPPNLSLYEASGLGTAGLTAALAVDRLENSGVRPADGPVAVTGATGGVGVLTIDMLAARGFEVVAISGKPDQEVFLRSIGAARIMGRDELMAGEAALAKRPRFAAAMDSVGGQILDRLMSNMLPHGKIAIAGMIGVELSTTVLPFVLRAVDILGINVSRQLQMPERRRLWERMARDLKPRHLPDILRPIAFTELDKTMDRLFNAASVGRIVVEVGSSAPSLGR